MDKKFICKLQGKEFVLYAGLLDEAHKEGLLSLWTEIIQFPSDENGNTCIIKATAKTENKTFVDVGDASPKSTGGFIVPHLIRMASTRAKARALRDLVNIGMCSVEELGGDTKASNVPEIEVSDDLLADRADEMSRSFELCTDAVELAKLAKAFKAEIDEMPTHLRDRLRNEYSLFETKLKKGEK